MGLGASFPSSAGARGVSQRWSVTDLLLGSGGSSSSSSSNAGSKRHFTATPASLLDYRAWSIDELLAFIEEQQRLLAHKGGIVAEKISREVFICLSRSYRLLRLALHHLFFLASTQAQRMSATQLVIAICLGALLFCLASLLVVRSNSKNRFNVLHEKIRLQDAAGNEVSLDSDGFEEDDHEADSVEGEMDVGDGVMRRLRSTLHTSRGQRRSFGGAESGSFKRRPSSIVRITSSDPRSQLSVQAIQMDLDPSNYLNPQHTSLIRDASISSSSGGSHGSPAPHMRRRKESGRLVSGPNDGASSSSASSSSTSSPSTFITHTANHLPRSVHSAARSAKQRRSGSRALDHEKRTSRSEHSSPRLDAHRESSIGLDPPGSPSSVYSLGSTQSDDDALWHDATPSLSPMRLASILRREPQFYASLPQLNNLQKEETDQVARDDLAMWKQSMASAEENGFANGDAFSSLPPSSSLHNRSNRLPPGAGHAPNSPFAKPTPALRLGTLSPEQMQSLWPEKRLRKVKLREPDWMPYVDIHERARERLEMFEQVTGTASPRSGSPMPSTGGSAFSEQTPSDGSLAGNDDEDPFWYERFTKSTAASGRDWDWRKRRARKNAATTRNSSLSSVETEILRTKPLPNQPENGNTVRFNGDDSASPVEGLTSGSNGGAPLLPEVAGTGGTLDASFVDSTGLNGEVLSNGTKVSPRLTDRLIGAGFTPIKRSRRSSEAEEGDDPTSLSVPGRLSSLKPKGVKKMLNRRDKSSVKQTNELDEEVDADGWTVEPDPSDLGAVTSEILADERSSRSVQRALDKSPMAAIQLDRAFADSTPNLVASIPISPHTSDQVFSSDSTPLNGWQEHRVWSSADAYGATPRSNGARSNSLFSRPSGGLSNDVSENAIPDDLANVYGSMYASSEIIQGGRPYVPKRSGTDPLSPPLSGFSALSKIDSDGQSSSSASLNPYQNEHPSAKRSSSANSIGSSPSRRNIVASARQAALR